jgi:hypothetical protein
MAVPPFCELETGCFCEYAITVSRPGTGRIGKSA